MSLADTLAAVRHRTLIAAVAGGAVAVVAIAMFGPGRARPVAAAQVWGGPLSTEDEDVTSSVRVVLLERLRGLETRPSGRAVVAEAKAANGARAHWTGATGPDGTAEATLLWERAPEAPIELRVSEVGGQPLAAGDLGLVPEGWGPGEATSAEIRGPRSGELAIRVAIPRGVLASPFREEAVVEVRRYGAPAPGARVTVTALGASLDAAEVLSASARVRLVADEEGRARFGVTPTAHAAEIEVNAALGGDTGHFEGRLSIMPGALWLEPAAPEAVTRRIVSPVAREVAYVSVATARSRIFGAAVPLSPTEEGFSEGILDLSPALSSLLRRDPVVVTVATSAGFDGAATVGWPLSPPHDPFSAVSQPFADVLLLDGMPRAEAAERERRNGWASFSVTTLALATLVEAALLFAAARAGRGRAVSNADDALSVLSPTATNLRLILAIALALLAFAGVGAVAIWASAG